MSYNKEMEREPRSNWFWTLLLLLAVGAGIVWFWDIDLVAGKNWFLKKDKAAPELADLIKNAPGLLKSLKLGSQDIAKDVFDLATKKPTEIAGDVAKDVGRAAADSFKGNVADVLGLVVPGRINNVAIVRPLNQPLSLIFETQQESLQFKINWGDGQNEEGSLAKKEQKIVEHLWREVGEYLVSVEIILEKDKSVKAASFPVRVIK